MREKDKGEKQKYALEYSPCTCPPTVVGLSGCFWSGG